MTRPIMRSCRAAKPLTCHGGTTWCVQTIPAGVTFLNLHSPALRGAWTGRWCAECAKVLGR